jgi:hypothetical protein
MILLFDPQVDYIQELPIQSLRINVFSLLE